MSRLLAYVRHFLLVLAVLAVPAIALALAYGADIDYGDDMRAYKVGDEGPHVFDDGTGWIAYQIRGNRERGFRLDERRLAEGGAGDFSVHFPLDDSTFSLRLVPQIDVPPAEYDDGQAIVAMSDLEGNFRAFRDFLIQHKVVGNDLRWAFGRGHLVLVGDMLDRGASVTQVLWLIYKLELEAREAGGQVHFIVGNHEIKNLQGNWEAAHKKYVGVASVLGRQPHDLLGPESYLGRWLASKNSIEKVNGYLFVHGGLHPQLAREGFTLDEINQVTRENYRRAFYPQPAPAGRADLLTDTRNGPAWYRGYFESALSQAEVETSLRHFGAKAVVVGHTPVWRVRSMFEGKVLAIDVKHPLDYRGSLPPRRSQGLLIETAGLQRLNEDGSRRALD